MSRIVPRLAGVPETLLWTLHARAGEAARPGGRLADPEGLRIYRSLDYDFERRFGPPSPLFAARAVAIDDVLRRWLRRHPDGQVISLGEGLETQAFRVDTGRMRWLSVDLPEAMAVRERFLSPTSRIRHFAGDVTEPGWMEAVEPAAHTFIVAQGLLMYLEPQMARDLLNRVARRFPGGNMVFDVVPRWLSESTLKGDSALADFVIPKMPWGLARSEVRSTLRGWCPAIRAVRLLRYRAPSRRPALLQEALERLSGRPADAPSLVHLSF